jgi:DNA invertase Pin-like site-specific DNA recombinase
MTEAKIQSSGRLYADVFALLELLETVKESGGTVIIEKLDRLARDLMVSESILADF